jgi:CRP/FNR family transcriptional regulator, anaerobic regulatory protein
LFHQPANQMKFPPQLAAFKQRLSVLGANPSDKDISLLLPFVRKKKFKKGELILKAGEICRESYFIISGLIRSYHKMNNNTEKTYIICKENNLFSEHSSFVSQKPSLDYIEALEDTEVYYITYDDLIHLYNSNLNWAIIGRIISDVNYLVSKNRMRSLMNDDATTRYKGFLETYKTALNRIPQNIIASYLGITPQSFSRLKKDFEKN